jgi:hypothetical protein
MPQHVPSIAAHKQYLVPQPKGGELVVLADSVLNAALVATIDRTMMLSPLAASTLRNALLGSPQQMLGKKIVPLSIGDAVSGTAEQRQGALTWLHDLVEDGWFLFSARPPAAQITRQGRIAAGGHIPAATFGGGKGVPVEYEGTTIIATVGRVKTHWYFADISLRDKQSIVDHGRAASVTDVGPLGTTLYPKAAPMRVGANCSICGACGTCGACGACALCGGVDFGVALTAAVAVDASLALVNAISVFGALRDARG